MEKRFLCLRCNADFTVPPALSLQAGVLSHYAEAHPDVVMTLGLEERAADAVRDDIDKTVITRTP
jgi:hypothetical protein